MPSLEYIVRPFQSPASLGAVIIPSTPSPTNERATLTWGAKAAVPAVTTGVGFAGCCQESADESNIQYEPVSVTNLGPDGGSVSFRRANAFDFDKTTKNECAGDWDQFSGVGMEVTAALDQFWQDVHSGTAAPTGDSGTCRGTMQLTNTPTGT